MRVLVAALALIICLLNFYFLMGFLKHAAVDPNWSRILFAAFVQLLTLCVTIVGWYVWIRQRDRISSIHSYRKLVPVLPIILLFVGFGYSIILFKHGIVCPNTPLPHRGAPDSCPLPPK